MKTTNCTKSHRLYNVLLHERFNLVELSSDSRSNCISGRFSSESQRQGRQRSYDQQQITLFSQTCRFIRSFLSWTNHYTVVGDIATIYISNVLHHVRSIEPSRFPRASLGTMTSRSPESPSQPVRDDRPCINHNSRDLCKCKAAYPLKEHRVIFVFMLRVP